MIKVHFLDTDDYQFPQETKDNIVEILDGAEKEVRALLPGLAGLLNVTIYPGKNVIPEKGETAHAINKDLIEFVVDPTHKRPIEEIIKTEFRRTLFHEAHHTVRFSASRWKESLVSDVIFEGLGTVFERDFAGGEQPWGEYDSSVIEDWTQEVLALDDTKINRQHWFFDHPDGRRWVGYKVGSYLVDEVIKNNPGQTAASLVSIPTSKILEMSGKSIKAKE